MDSDKKLDFLMSQNEGQFLGFKSSVSTGLDREMVAFANSGGGSILIGVDNNRNVIGVSDASTQISRLESIARNCDPSVIISVDVHGRDNSDIIMVEIPEGADRPYSCSSGFYLRSGASTQKMKRDEIIEFLYSTGQVKYEEKLCTSFRYPRDFDGDTFRQFLVMANISPSELSTEDMLLNLGVAIKKGDELIFNNAGVLFFAREPVRFLRHAVVDCVLFSGADRVDILDRKELKGSLIENVKQALIFLNQHLSVKYKIDGLIRKEILEIP